MRHPIVSRGFALIELLLVLGIGTALMVAVWAMYATRNEDLRVEQSFDAIDQLVMAADSNYSSSRGYFLATTPAQPATLAQLHAAIGELPDPIIHQGGSSYTNPWGGTWTVSAASTAGTHLDLLTIALTNLPAQSCVSLVSRMAPRMYDTRVNNTLVGLAPARTTDAAGRNQVRAGQLIPLCQQANNTVLFRRLKPINYSMLRDQPMDPNTLSARETTDYLPVFQRVEQAMANREAAQVAIP